MPLHSLYNGIKSSRGQELKLEELNGENGLILLVYALVLDILLAVKVFLQEILPLH